MTIIGAMSRRDVEGLRGRGRIVWAACPDCGRERWVPVRTPNVRCRSCSGKVQISRPEFRDAFHKQDCRCQRCAISRGELTTENNPNWSGGRRMHAGGYVYLLLDRSDPMRVMSDCDGYAFEHRIVMARYLGRPLSASETVHHRNGNRADNRLENLELWIGNHGNGQRQRDYHCPGCRCFEHEEAHHD